MRTYNWLARNQQEIKDIGRLIDDEEKVVEVWRTEENDEEIGFEKAAQPLILTKRIRARIDKARAGFIKIDTDDSRINNHEFIGTTLDDDIRLGDVWKTMGIEFKVTAFDILGQPYKEVRLEVLT